MGSAKSEREKPFGRGRGGCALVSLRQQTTLPQHPSAYDWVRFVRGAIKIPIVCPPPVMWTGGASSEPGAGTAGRRPCAFCSPAAATPKSNHQRPPHAGGLPPCTPRQRIARVFLACLSTKGSASYEAAPIFQNR